MQGQNSLTPEEVAEILNIKKNTVYALIKRGKLSAYRVGRKLRIEQNDVEDYKKRSKEISPAQPIVTPPAPVLPPFAHREASEPPPDLSGLVIYGQDILLDILSRHIEKQSEAFRVFRKHIGSFPGLLALYEGKATVASTHLWDSDTDSYNIPYIRRLLPGIPTAVIHLARRMQGFYVKQGNPLNIITWEDLIRPEVKFVNREPGSGTRILLDEQMRKKGINRLKINGYHNIENSHTAVAIAVARGAGNVGLGNQKAAMQVEGIEFIPLQMERYELAIKEEDLNRPEIQVLLSILTSNYFREEIEGLGGYQVDEIGCVVARV